MKAIKLFEYGSAEVLKYEEVEKPVPADNEVLIKVKAAALNPIDSKIRNGFLKEVMPLPLPLILGWEVSGVIEEIGNNVTGLKVGDEVIARPSLQRGGGYSQYLVAGENEVAPKPKSLSFTDAAALPLVASAAYIILFKTANIQAGQKIFVLGASGSVGLFVVQMAKLAGAQVIGTAKGDDIELLKSLGADEVIDYTTTNYTDVVKNTDIAIDLVGGPEQAGLWQILKRGGVLLSTVMPPSQEKAKEYGITASFVFTTPDKEALEKVSMLAEEGKIKPRVGMILPLEEATQAHLLMDSRSVNGKIILEVN